MQKLTSISFKARIWLYPSATAAWHFVSLPTKESREIRNTYKGNARAWGSLPVRVTVGATVWETSIFPDSRSGTYLLPLKAAVRKREGLHEDDTVAVVLAIR